MADRGDDPDADLVAGAIAGDRAAFSALLERHYDRIHGLAWQLTGTRADADDVAQDVCSRWSNGSDRSAARPSSRPGCVASCSMRAAIFIAAANRSVGSPRVLRCWQDWPEARRPRSARRDVGEERNHRFAPAYRDTVVLVAGQQLSMPRRRRSWGWPRPPYRGGCTKRGGCSPVRRLPSPDHRRSVCEK